MRRATSAGASTSIRRNSIDGCSAGGPRSACGAAAAMRRNATRYNHGPFRFSPNVNASLDLRSELQDWLSAAIAQAAPGAGPAIGLERPKQAQHGDYATTVALQLAKPLRANPREGATRIVAALKPSPWVESTEIAGAGFINIHLTPVARQAVIREIHARGALFGTSTAGHQRRVMIEFVSANPTGPLHVGHGRQAALGDALANVLAAQGWDVYREFYYNDAGEQINNLTRSVQARIRQLRDPDAPFPEAAYHLSLI